MRGGKLLCNSFRASVWEDENVQDLRNSDGVKVFSVTEPYGKND